MSDDGQPRERFTPDAYRALSGFDSDWRDLWWNEDFLGLMAERWQLADVHSALDVGCGVGHFGQRLAAFLPESATLAGVDLEEDFLVSARERAAARGLAGRASYQVGSATALPFDDNSFDLVTFQTVLMHVGDPQAAIAEAIRVLKPGGLIVAAEPAQLASAIALMGAHPRVAEDDLLAMIELYLVCMRGKREMGAGDSNIGELVPGFFREAGLRDIRVYQNDRCAALLPPYDTPAEKLDLAQQLEWIDADVWITGRREDSLRRFLAGGGQTEDFERLWATAIRVNRRQAADLRAGVYHGGRGFVQYVVSGRKP